MLSDIIVYAHACTAENRRRVDSTKFEGVVIMMITHLSHFLEEKKNITFSNLLKDFLPRWSKSNWPELKRKSEDF